MHPGMQWHPWARQMAARTRQAELEANLRQHLLSAKLQEGVRRSKQIAEDCRQSRLRAERQTEAVRKWSEKVMAERKEARGLPAKAAPPPAPPAAGPWPAPSLTPTPGASRVRTTAAEVSAAAAMAWASTAAGHEAAATAAERRAETQSAVHGACAATEWARAAAAWRAAYDELEAAAQADPESEAVRQADAALATARGFRRGWPGTQGSDSKA